MSNARLGEPRTCPKCSGHLRPAFGAIDEGGVRKPVIDPTVMMCPDCGALVPVTPDDALSRT